MEKKRELLDHYIDFLNDNLKLDLLGIESLINIDELKKSLDFNKSIYLTRKQIDRYFKERIVEYLNNRYSKFKDNTLYNSNRYDLFDLEYDLCFTFLEMNNFRGQFTKVEDTEINEEYDVDKCKELVLDFYKNLLNDESDVKIIQSILDRISFTDEDIRSYFNTNTKEVLVSKSKCYSFVMTIAHEVAHAYSAEKQGNFPKDIRLIEMDSLCIEVLLLRYLADNNIPILKGGEVVGEKELSDFIANIYTMIVINSKRVLDEMLITSCIGDKQKIDMEVFEDICKQEPYSVHYLAKTHIINAFMDRYINKEDIEGFNNNVSYICSSIFSTYFFEVTERDEEKQKFAYYLNHNGEFNFLDFIEYFGFPPEKFHILLSIVVSDFANMVNYEKEVFPINDIYKEVINQEIEEYNEIVEKELNSDYTEEEKIYLIRKLAVLLNRTTYSLDLYPFDIEYQLEDEEVEEFNKTKKRLLELTFKNNGVDL